MTALILTHWVLNIQLIVETDASNYALAAILFIMTGNNRIHLIAFYSYTFTSLKLNYNVHDKELLTIFETFQIWQYYLEGSKSPINVVTDYKNLEYFSTKVLIH